MTLVLPTNTAFDIEKEEHSRPTSEGFRAAHGIRPILQKCWESITRYICTSILVLLADHVTLEYAGI